MRLREEQLARFRESGLLILTKLFSDQEVDLLCSALSPVMAQTDPAAEVLAFVEQRSLPAETESTQCNAWAW